MAQWAGIPGRRCGRHAESWSGGHHRDLCGLSGGRVLGFTGLDDRDLSAVLYPDPGRGADPDTPPRQPERARLRQRRLCRRDRHDPRRLRPARQDCHRRLTILIALGSLGILFRWKVNNPLLVGATAVIGLIAFPLLQPAWVMVK